MLCSELFAGNVSIIRRWRPDRIVWRPDGYIDVVEYCTADTTEAHLAVLRGKVRSCMRQLAAMGHNGIRGFIWDLDASVVHRLSVMASQ